MTEELTGGIAGGGMAAFGGTMPTAEEQLARVSPLNIKQDYTLNEAQSILYAMGTRPELLFAHHQEVRGSCTKRGPGRIHKQGS